MFPARAGMSLTNNIIRGLLPDVPRASGDEPHNSPTTLSAALCSPRERG